MFTLQCQITQYDISNPKQYKKYIYISEILLFNRKEIKYIASLSFYTIKQHFTPSLKFIRLYSLLPFL